MKRGAFSAVKRKGEKKVGRLFFRQKRNRVDTKEMERIVFDCKICKLMNRINFRDKHDNKRKSWARARASRRPHSACSSVPRQDGEWFVRVFARNVIIIILQRILHRKVSGKLQINICSCELNERTSAGARCARLPHWHSFHQWFDYNVCALFAE